MARGIIALVFRCKVVSGHLAVNDEVSRFRWATPEEVKTMAVIRTRTVLHSSPANRVVPTV